MSVLDVPLLGRESSLVALEDGFTRHKDCELAFMPEVI
jgi:hypothetical protein